MSIEDAIPAVDARPPELNRSPHKAKPINGAKEAWWYEDETGIGVYIWDGERTLSCQIYRAPLRRWLAKVSP